MAQRTDPDLIRQKTRITLWRAAGLSYRQIALRLDLTDPDGSGARRIRRLCQKFGILAGGGDGRAQRIGHAAVRGRAWTDYEDRRLLQLAKRLRTGGWTRIGAAMGRPASSCQARLETILHNMRKAAKYGSDVAGPAV